MTPTTHLPAKAARKIHKRSSRGDFAVWEHDVYCWPSGEDLAAGAYMLASVSLRFPVAADLPEPGAAGADAETCVEAVEILVEALNAIVGPVIDRIEGS